VQLRSVLIATTASVTVALAVPLAAQAATKSVDLGPAPATAKALQKYGADVDAFFPTKLSIHVGDKVKFTPYGFHNVDLAKAGGRPVALFSPNGQTATNVVDAAGAAFWFNSQPLIGFTSSLVTGQNFGKTVSYSGAKAVNSGLPLADKPKPFTVKFTKTGTFTYYCDVHPGMKASVKVLAKSKTVPTAAADKKAVKAQADAAIKTAKSLVAKTPAAGTIDVGEHGKGGVELMAFNPAAATVAVGTTVNFTMPVGSYEAHTATSGPGDPGADPASYLGALAASFESPAVDPRASYPSEAPGTVATLTPTLHGNGFWNTGVLDAEAASPLPASGAVTFGAAGQYTFYCLIHPFMKTTVTVQ
jgi:plastocyanin